MLGERGLWFKMSFLEGSARTPLLISAPEQPATTITAPVSNLDILPTVCDLAGIDMEGIKGWTDGESLVPVIAGDKQRAAVPIEYAAEGSYAPMVALVEDRYKYIVCDLDPDQMFDLEQDPHELTNLAADPDWAHIAGPLRQQIDTRWDLASYDDAVRHSQSRRLIVYQALRNGNYFPWDYQPLQQASERYMRNHMDLNVLEEAQRFPRGE